MAYRAFFALPVENFATAAGAPTNAIYGFASMLVNILKSERPTHVAVAFDVSRRSFRTEKFPEYKANRSKSPDEFKSQIPTIYELIHAFGIPTFELEGYEADDLIATITESAVKSKIPVVICTGDRDSFQLVNDSVTVLYPKKGVTELARMTPSEITEKYGVTPEQYADFAALRGDPSDNLPGIPGVGEKTAAKWISEFGSIKTLIAKADSISGKVGQALKENIASVLLNRELNQLIKEVPIDFKIANLKWAGLNLAALTKLLREFEIKSLTERIKLLPADESSSTIAIDTHETQNQSLDGQIKITQISGKELAQKISKESITQLAVAIDLLAGKLVQYSVFLPTSSNSKEVECFWVRESDSPKWLTDSSISKILHSAKPAIRYLNLSGLKSDTELMAYLVNPGARNLELSDLITTYLGIFPSEVSGDLFSDFRPEAAVWCFKVESKLKKELTDRNMLRLYEELELPTLIRLAELEQNGISVNKNELTSMHKSLVSEVEKETKSAHQSAGHEFNVASPKQLQAVLFDELKLPKTKKIKTGFTTDAESLEWLFQKTKHPILQNLLRIREATKLATTIEGLITAIQSDGRIHTTFQQTVAATGRLSSTEPNLQNIPVRTDEGRKIRNCFVAGQGFENLLTADYSQIEMRIMAHLSADKGLIAAFKSGEDLHSTVAGLVFGVSADQVDSEMRRKIKAMSYGLAYGLSAFGLANQLDLDPGEAAALMNKYFERFGGIQDYLREVVNQARQKGYTETITGRRRYLPDLNHENRQRREIAERAALNAPIQGSAADIIKVALLNIMTEIEKQSMKSRPLLQVHDELIFEIFPGESEKLVEMVKSKMASAFKLSVPLDVNIGIGKSWHQAAH